MHGLAHPIRSTVCKTSLDSNHDCWPHPEQATTAVEKHGIALVGLAREALLNPNLPLRYSGVLEGQEVSQKRWPKQAAWALGGDLNVARSNR